MLLVIVVVSHHTTNIHNTHYPHAHHTRPSVVLAGCDDEMMQLQCDDVMLSAGFRNATYKYMMIYILTND